MVVTRPEQTTAGYSNDNESIVSNNEKERSDWKQHVSASDAVRYDETASRGYDDETREPCSYQDYEADSITERESYDGASTTRDTEEVDEPELGGGVSDELALKLLRRRESMHNAASADATISSDIETPDEVPEVRGESRTMLNETHFSYSEEYNGLDDRANETTDELALKLLHRRESMHNAAADATISSDTETPDEVPEVRSESRTMLNETHWAYSEEYSGLDDRVSEATPSTNEGNNAQTEPSSKTQMNDSNHELRTPNNTSLHTTIDDTSNKLDAALWMMERLQREDANRKIQSMLQVKKDVGKDKKQNRSHSYIDWETGECDHTPWVGQVGINDEIFEDEPLEYAESGRRTKESSPPRFHKWIHIEPTVRRKLWIAATIMFAIAGALGAGALLQVRRNNEPCSLCYDGFIPDDLSSSMVGGDTCADFRTSVESYRSSDKMCLQGQSLAWLMCDCPTLPPFPKRPSCTLCGEGVLLKGSACNHINTFMAHISDPEYCEALKNSVSKAGCACPNE